jgi:hypothetical protein
MSGLCIPRRQLVEGIRRDPKVCFLASVEDNVAIEFSPKDVAWVKGSGTEFAES